MNSEERLELTGAPGSPYTRKMLGILRYRHIPYKVFWGTGNIPKGYPAPKVILLPTFYFKDGPNGGLVPVTDSTPITRRLEREYSGRSLLPSNPALEFINDLIEDYGDEWLTKAMFHFRWAHREDAENAAPLLVYWGMNTAEKTAAEQMARQFASRQIERLYVVGSNEVTGKTIETSYQRLIEAIDSIIQKKGFILGSRPSSADFAIFGQLTQLAVVEPTSAKVTKETSQRIRAWVDIMEDVSGVDPAEDDWISIDEAKEHLDTLLCEIGRTYVPAMLANAKAIQSGDDRFETQIDGLLWQQPVFKYQAKCLGWLRDSYKAKSDSDRSLIDSLLSGTGCEKLLS